MKYINSLKFIISIVICLISGMIGSIFTSTSVNTWYRILNKPVFNPPDWLFAPIWTFLYITMGISLFLVWISEGSVRKIKYMALTLFVVQLLFNVLWSAFFFGMRSPFLSFIDIILLWGSIIFTMIFFKKISFLAVILLVPYLLWVTFAGVLNYAILVMN